LVEAAWSVLVFTAAVGTMGVPVNVGDALGASGATAVAITALTSTAAWVAEVAAADAEDAALEADCEAAAEEALADAE
jgi:hypothetical protein